MAAHGYQYRPSASVASWLFSGSAGVSANASAFTTGNPNAPDGNQVAFLQNNGSSMSETVYLAGDVASGAPDDVINGVDYGVYNVSFLAAQRNKNQSHYQTVNILVDGNVVGTANPSEHVVRLVRDCEFHGPGGNAHHYVRRFGPAGRRQHGLHRRRAVEFLKARETMRAIPMNDALLARAMHGPAELPAALPVAGRLWPARSNGRVERRAAWHRETLLEHLTTLLPPRRSGWPRRDSSSRPQSAFAGIVVRGCRREFGEMPAGISAGRPPPPEAASDRDSNDP